MGKAFYTDYVRHALRFYTRNLDPPRFMSNVSEDNWTCCHEVIKSYSTKDRDILVAVYSGYDTLSDNVYEMAKKYDLNQGIIWDMMKEFERKIAIKRGLI